MKLAKLIEQIEIVETAGSSEVEIKAIALDSRTVAEGYLFACVRGANVDGHDFASEAVSRGAIAVLCDHRLPLEVTQIVVRDVRKALARMSARLYGMPSRQMRVVGVTGTNGKTTTVHLVRSILLNSGKSVGLMGTLGHMIGGRLEQDVFTTPEAPDVQRNMREMIREGAEYCVMEVSSHAIALRRADCIDFDVVAFTNLSRDHLDFHGDFDNYRSTKMQLFEIGKGGHDFGENRIAVVNVGDETGKVISNETPLRKLTFGLDCDADVVGRITKADWQGTTLEIGFAGKTVSVDSRLRGRSNAENILTAFAIAKALGIEDDAIVKGIASMEHVPGRMEVISGMGRIAIVDYAHTPDALRRLLVDVRSLAPSRLICVFGCGGDRDRGKRPEMGRIVAELADVAIVTSDNPRTEDPQKIIDDILAGIPDESVCLVESDRAAAIRKAVEISEDDDVIVVAGKGHENYQIIGTQRIPFDDREVVRAALGVNADARS